MMPNIVNFESVYINVLCHVMKRDLALKLFLWFQTQVCLNGLGAIQIMRYKLLALS